jgi:hypothetical protein
MSFKNLFPQILAGLIAVVIWESLKLLLNKTLEYNNMEHAGITNFWFILFFISVNLLFFLLYYRERKNTNNSKIRKDSIEAGKEPLSKEYHVYDILDDCVYDALSKWYINPVTDEIFCFKCWHENKSKIPIAKDGFNLSSWICPKCNKPYTSAVRTLKKLYMKNHSASIMRQRSEE